MDLFKRRTLRTCCCCKVRTACIVFGFVGAISGLLGLIQDTREIISIASQDPKLIELTEEFYREIGWDADRETLELAFLMTKIFSGFDLLTSIGLVVSSCMMVYGIKKEKDRFLLPAIYYIPIDGLLRFIQVTAYTAIFGFLHPVSSIINAFYIVEIIIDFFIWLCVYSHRREIKYQLKDAEEMEEMT